MRAAKARKPRQTPIPHHTAVFSEKLRCPTDSLGIGAIALASGEWASAAATFGSERLSSTEGVAANTSFFTVDCGARFHVEGGLARGLTPLVRAELNPPAALLSCGRSSSYGA